MSFRAVLKEIPDTLKLAVPISLGMLSHMLIQLTDTIMLGHYGTTELAAAAFSGSLVLILLYIGLGFGQAVTVLASQALGAGDPLRARGIYHLSAMGGFFYAAIGIVVTILFVIPAFDHMGQPALVAAQGKPFALLLALSFIPTLLFQNLRSYYDSLKRPWVPFAHMIALLLLNVLFNWIFIFGKFGFPEMGIIGSGLGTLLARTVVAVAFFIFAHQKGEVLHTKIDKKTLPFSSIPRILTIAAAHGTQMVVTLLAYVVGGVWIGTLGAEAMAANRIIGTFDATIFMIPLGLGTALSIRIGRSRGAGDIAKANTIYRGGFLLTFIFCGAVALCMAGFPQVITGWFTTDAATLAIAQHLIIIAAVFCIFDNLANITLASLRGLGDVVTPALTYLGLYWLLAMPLAWMALFRWGAGPEGVWWSYCLGIILGCIFLTVRFRLLTHPGRTRWTAPPIATH